MKDWFSNLAQREQLFIAGGAVVVAIALLYTLVWVPLDEGRQEMAAEVEVWQRSLADLKPLRGMQPAGGGNPATSSSAGLDPVVVVDQTLRARGLDRAMKRSQPTTSTGIRVEFENVAFDDLVLWLGDLSAQHAMEVTSGSMSSTSQTAPGRINATFTLERS